MKCGTQPRRRKRKWDRERLRRIARTPWTDLTPVDQIYMTLFCKAHSKREVEEALAGASEETDGL